MRVAKVLMSGHQGTDRTKQFLYSVIYKVESCQSQMLNANSCLSSDNEPTTAICGARKYV